MNSYQTEVTNLEGMQTNKFVGVRAGIVRIARPAFSIFMSDRQQLLVFLMAYDHEKIVLFDGVCNYCNAMVNLAIRNDNKAVLKFATLQSENGKTLKSKFDIPAETDSVILIENEKYYTYSDAAIRIAKYLRWPAKALYALIIIPRFIRQPIYKWIAKNRYKWFGKKEQCMIPTPDVKARFLT